MQRSYMGQLSTCAAMLAFLRCIYYLIGQSLAVSSASGTVGNSHSPPIIFCAVIPTIHLAAQWCNTSSTFSVLPITTQLLLPYKIPTAWMPCKSSLTPITFPPSLLPPSPPSPTATVNSEGFDTRPPSRYCYRRLCSPGMERPRPAS